MTAHGIDVKALIDTLVRESLAVLQAITQGHDVIVRAVHDKGGRRIGRHMLLQTVMVHQLRRGVRAKKLCQGTPMGVGHLESDNGVEQDLEVREPAGGLFGGLHAGGIQGASGFPKAGRDLTHEQTEVIRRLQ